MKTFYKSCKYCPEERETLLRYDSIDKCWYMESNILRHFSKALRKGWQVTSQTMGPDGKICHMTFIVPEKAVTFRSINNILNDSQNIDLNDDFEEE